jgi:protein-disulfide isomerase
VDIALLYFEGCPHAQAAETHLRAAVADIDTGDTGQVVVRKQLVDTVDEAKRVGFLGSPTILIDGRDPFAVPGATPGLSCRVYATDTGLTGAPTVVQLRDALTAARADRHP